MDAGASSAFPQFATDADRGGGRGVLGPDPSVDLWHLW